MRIALALTVALAACSSNTATSSRVSTDDAPKLLIDRNWMDRMPETDRDKLPAHEGKPVDVAVALVPLVPFTLAPAGATVTVDDKPAIIEGMNATNNL